MQINEKKVLSISVALPVVAAGCLVVTGYINNLFYTIPAWVDSVSSLALIIAILLSGFGIGYATFAIIKIKGWHKVWPITIFIVCIFVLLFSYAAYWMGGY